jgi:hypothetical protein
MDKSASRHLRKPLFFTHITAIRDNPKNEENVKMRHLTRMAQIP